MAVLDHLPSLTAKKADLLLPTTALSEGAGTLINNEGRMQAFSQVFSPGEPLRITSQGSHPPRSFSTITPGALPCQAWAVLAELCDLTVDLAEIRQKLAAKEPRLAGLLELSAEGTGQLIQTGDLGSLPLPLIASSQIDALQLLVCETLYGSEPLSAHSAPLEPVRPQPYLLLHELDAAQLGIATDDLVQLRVGEDQLTLPARLSNRMAAGVVILPHLRCSELESFYPGQPPLPCRVEKVSAT